MRRRLVRTGARRQMRAASTSKSFRRERHFRCSCEIMATKPYRPPATRAPQSSSSRASRNGSLSRPQATIRLTRHVSSRNPQRAERRRANHDAYRQHRAGKIQLVRKGYGHENTTLHLHCSSLVRTVRGSARSSATGPSAAPSWRRCSCAGPASTGSSPEPSSCSDGSTICRTAAVSDANGSNDARDAGAMPRHDAEHADLHGNDAADDAGAHGSRGRRCQDRWVPAACR